MKDFKYKTFFNTTIPVILATDAKAVTAPLQELRSLLPDEDEVEENEDLLYTAFNSCVINLVNSNDDGIMTDEGLGMAPKFIDRQLNIEHNRSMVVGHITGYGFSSFVENKIVNEKDLIDTKDPFNIALSGVIYKVVDPYFADFLKETSDEKGFYYKSISASWEVGFDEFVICIGSKKIKDAEIISEEDQVKDLSQYLKCMGGTGFMKDGTPVYRVVVGRPRPLGCGFTGNPAAAVQGVLVAKEDLLEKEEYIGNIKENQEIEENNEKNDVFLSILANYDKQLTENGVTINNPTIKMMKIKKIEDIQQDKWEEISASSVRDFIVEKIDEANSEYVKREEQSQNEKNDLLAEKTKLEETVNSAIEKIGTLESELDALKQERLAIIANQQFQDRMSALDEEFNLEDAQRKIVAKQIQGLSDEEFLSWKEDFSVFASQKAESQNESREQLATEALASVDTKCQERIPNAQTIGEDLLVDTFRESFALGKGVSIAKRK